VRPNLYARGRVGLKWELETLDGEWGEDRGKDRGKTNEKVRGVCTPIKQTSIFNMRLWEKRTESQFTPQPEKSMIEKVGFRGKISSFPGKGSKLSSGRERGLGN